MSTHDVSVVGVDGVTVLIGNAALRSAVGTHDVPAVGDSGSVCVC